MFSLTIRASALFCRPISNQYSADYYIVPAHILRLEYLSLVIGTARFLAVLSDVPQRYVALAWHFAECHAADHSIIDPKPLLNTYACHEAVTPSLPIVVMDVQLPTI